jgi:hypothetical protein
MAHVYSNLQTYESFSRTDAGKQLYNNRLVKVPGARNVNSSPRLGKDEGKKGRNVRRVESNAEGTALSDPIKEHVVPPALWDHP